MKSITCPQCGWTSHHPADVKWRFCGRCHQYHDKMYITKMRAALKLTPEDEEAIARLLDGEEK